MDLRESVTIFILSVTVEDGQIKRSKGREGGVVEDDGKRRLIANARKAGEEGVGELDQRVEDVLEEDEKGG